MRAIGRVASGLSGDQPFPTGPAQRVRHDSFGRSVSRLGCKTDVNLAGRLYLSRALAGWPGCVFSRWQLVGHVMAGPLKKPADRHARIVPPRCHRWSVVLDLIHADIDYGSIIDETAAAHARGLLAAISAATLQFGSFRHDDSLVGRCVAAVDRGESGYSSGVSGYFSVFLESAA